MADCLSTRASAARALALAALTGGALATGALAAPGAEQTCFGESSFDVVGTRHADVIVGTPGPDRVDAGRCDDVLVGLVGLDGGDGYDGLAFAGTGTDRLLGGAGDDRLQGGPDDDVLDGGDGNDTVGHLGTPSKPATTGSGGGRGDDALDAGRGLTPLTDRTESTPASTASATRHPKTQVVAATGFRPAVTNPPGGSIAVSRWTRRTMPC